jgi:hypothetical protein
MTMTSRCRNLQHRTVLLDEAVDALGLEGARATASI